MDSIRPQMASGTMAPQRPAVPLDDTIEKDNVQGNRDLAIVFVLISLAVPFFVVSLRVFHPRRIIKYSAHDYLFFIAMFFGLVTTAGMITELRFGINATTDLVGRTALIATICTTMEFFTAVTLGRLSALVFALKIFGDKIRNPCRETIVYRVIIISILVGASVQGAIAIITTGVGCSPVSSVGVPSLWENNCKYYNQIQIVHSATNFWKNAVIIITFTVLYMRRGYFSSRTYLKWVVLVFALVTCICGLARTILIKRHISEVFPPLRMISPKILLILEMDLVLTTVGLLTISTAIEPRHDQSSMELGIQAAIKSDGCFGEHQLRGKAIATTWDALPDLEFQSDNPYGDFKGKTKPKMMDQATMTSPSFGRFMPRPPKALLRGMSATPTYASKTAISGSKPISTSSQASLEIDELFIPPLPFQQSAESLVETPVYTQHKLARQSRRLSTTSSTSSSSLSSGPFSENDYNEDDEDEIVVQPRMTRPQSVADHMRQPSVVIMGQRSSWGIHEVDASPQRSQSQ